MGARAHGRKSHNSPPMQSMHFACDSAVLPNMLDIFLLNSVFPGVNKKIVRKVADVFVP